MAQPTVAQEKPLLPRLLPGTYRPEAVRVEEEPKKEKPSPLAFEWGLNATNKYMLKGMEMTEKPAVMSHISVIYPSMKIGDIDAGDVVLTGLGIFGTRENHANEADVFIDLEKPLGNGFKLLGGYGLLTFPSTDDEKTQEGYLGIKFERDDAWYTSLKLFRDFDEINGNYGELEGGYNFKLGDVPLTIKGRLGYDDHFMSDNSGLSYGEIGLQTDIDLTDNVKLTPYGSYIGGIDRENFDDSFNFGLKVVIPF
jgi:hypothetical protein